MSWKGERGVPSFSTKQRYSRVLGAPILRAVYSEGFPYDIVAVWVGEAAVERCRVMASVRAEAMLAAEEL